MGRATGGIQIGEGVFPPTQGIVVTNVFNKVKTYPHDIPPVLFFVFCFVFVRRYLKPFDILLEGRTEGMKEFVLFNDALKTFYLLLYGVEHMVKNHSDSERGNPLPALHGLFFPISSKGSFICTTVLVTAVVKYWLE